MSEKRYIERSVGDDNFAHTLMLLGATIAWGRTLKEGQRLSFNDINMVQIPMECAEAMTRWIAEFAPEPIAAQCRAAVQQIDSIRVAFFGSRKRAKPKANADPALV